MYNNYFYQVEMGKLEMKTLAKERRVTTSPIRRNKNRAGIIESCVKICGDCGEEYCFGESCGDILYDSFVRVVINLQQKKIKITEDTTAIMDGINCGKQKNKKTKDKNKNKKVTRVKVNGKSTRLLGRGGKSRKAKSDTSKRSVVINEDNNQYDNNIEVKKFKRKCTNYLKNKKKKKNKSTSSLNNK